MNGPALSSFEGMLILILLAAIVLYGNIHSFQIHSTTLKLLGNDTTGGIRLTAAAVASFDDAQRQVQDDDSSGGGGGGLQNHSLTTLHQGNHDDTITSHSETTATSTTTMTTTIDSQVRDRAYVTLIATSEYILGAKMLVCRLRGYSPNLPILVMVDEQVDISFSKPLFDAMNAEIIMVRNPVLDLPDDAATKHEVRKGTYTKLLVWSVPNVETGLYLDADVLPLRNPEFCFDVLGARQDYAVVGKSTYFNTGVFVFKPTEETLKALLERLRTGNYRKLDESPTEQDLIVSHFGATPRRIKFLHDDFNFRPFHHQEWEKKFDAIFVHWIGNPKPWTKALGKESSIVGLEITSDTLPTWSYHFFLCEMERFLHYCYDVNFAAVGLSECHPNSVGDANKDRPLPPLPEKYHTRRLRRYL